MSHEKAASRFRRKMRKLGYDAEDTKEVREYISDHAPLIIHVRLEKHIKHFLKDTHYRNTFELSEGSKCRH